PERLGFLTRHSEHSLHLRCGSSAPTQTPADTEGRGPLAPPRKHPLTLSQSKWEPLGRLRGKGGCLPSPQPSPRTGRGGRRSEGASARRAAMTEAYRARADSSARRSSSSG